MRLQRTGWALVALAVALLVVFNVIGSHVDESGTLHEPFALIPLAWLSAATGAVLIATAMIRKRRRR